MSKIGVKKSIYGCSIADSKAKVYEYIQEAHPNWGKKTSTVQIGRYADHGSRWAAMRIEKLRM
jgi:hypothetical protein